MKSVFAPRNLFLLILAALVSLTAACRGPAPTATPPPPTGNVPTALPPAPTAPLLTQAPTAVLPTQAPPPAATDVPLTNAPAATTTATTAATNAPANPTAANPPSAQATNPPAPVATVDRGPLTGLYVTGLRFEPSFPRTNDPITFYATLVNQTGKEQHYPVCAEIFRPAAAKSFGISNCSNLTIVPGTSEVLAGMWIGSGIKECIPVRARAVLREEGEGEVRQVFTTTNGGELWVDFNVCP